MSNCFGYKVDGWKKSQRGNDMAMYNSKRYPGHVFSFNRSSEKRPESYECKGCKAKNNRKTIKILRSPATGDLSHHYFATDPDEFEHVCLAYDDLLGGWLMLNEPYNVLLILNPTLGENSIRDRRIDRSLENQSAMILGDSQNYPAQVIITREGKQFAQETQIMFQVNLISLKIFLQFYSVNREINSG